jgi:sugar/nucleoside kinase (ribokinase family)
MGSGFNLTLGGSSSILALNLSVLDALVDFTSPVGRDEKGEIAIAHLAEAGIGISHIARKSGSGTRVTILFPHGGCFRSGEYSWRRTQDVL